MDSEFIAVIVLWLIIGPILFKTFKNFFFESKEEKTQREKQEEKKKKEQKDFQKYYEKFEQEQKTQLEQERKKREAEGSLLFDAPSKELEEQFAERAAYYANRGMDMPYPSKEEIEKMKENLKKRKN